MDHSKKSHLSRIHGSKLNRRFVAALTVVVILGSFAPDCFAACAETPTGVTAWWGADGNAGDVYGTWNGTLVGSTSYATGQVGEAFSLDGSGARVDVDEPGAGELGAAPFSIDLWFNTDIVGNGTYIIGKSNPSGGAGWDIRLSDRRIQLVGFNGWPAQYNLQTFQIVTVGQWHHLAVTSDGSTVTLYFDGATDPTWTIPRQPISSTGNPLRFGMTTNFGGIPFDGEIDEIRFFDRALDAAEVAGIFNAGTDGTCRPCAALPSGALGWWRAEDNGDDAVANNNGLPDNGASFTDGVVGRSFDFDGTDDVVRIPDDDVWDFGTSSFALSAWFKSSNATGYHNITRFHNGGAASGFALRLEPSGLIQFRTADVGAACTANITSTGAWDDNEWHHVVAVRDADAGELRIYVDGVADATPVSDGGCSVTGASDNKLGIGAGQWGGSSGTWEHFDGPIDEVTILAYAPTENEVQMLYNAQSSGICSSCVEPAPDQVGWWRGEGSAFDSVGDNHGTVVNNAGFAPGLVGSTIDFPAGNDYIEVPHDAELSFAPTDPLSIEFWIRRATDQDVQHILGKRVDCGGGQFNYQFWWHQSGDEFCFGGITGSVCTTESMLPLQQWTHVAASFDGTDATLHINGDPVASAAMQLGPDSTSPPLRLGTSGTCASAGQGFSGRLDEIQIFDRALSRSEITADFAAGRHGACRECAPLPDGLAAWWRGDGDAGDVTGANDGAEMNGAGYGTGLVGRAFSFDDDTLPDYIEVPHSPSLDITGVFSSEGWIYLDDEAAGNLYTKADSNGNLGSTSYGSSIVGGHIVSILYGSYPADSWTSTDTIETGAWHHLAFTWDGSTSTPENVKLYLDGTLSQSWSKTNPMDSNVQSLTIGAMKPPTYHNATDGRIDELAIYSAELTADEIAAIYRAGSAGKCDPLDLVPDPFDFVDQFDVGVSADIVSNSITVTGIDAPTSIGISSCTSSTCEYAINGGGWTSSAGLAAEGDSVAVRQRSSSFFSSTTNLTLDIGSVTDTFSVTTIAGHTLTVLFAGDGFGSVVSTPAGIDCPSGACFWKFAEGSFVALTPTANDGSAFAGWSGPSDCVDGQVTMNGDLNCVANFDFLGIFADGFESGDTTRWSAGSP